MKKSDMVEAFHKRFKIPIREGDFNDVSLVLYRMELMSEEMREAYEAVAKNDPEEFLDALVDLMYFIYGAALVFNYDIDEAFWRVHKANMNKLGPDGEVHYRSDGKVLKPPGWEAPVLTDLVFNLEGDKT